MKPVCHRPLCLFLILCLSAAAFTGCVKTTAPVIPSHLLPAQITQTDTGMGEHLVYCSDAAAANGLLYISGVGPYPSDANTQITWGHAWGDLVIRTEADGGNARCIPLELPSLPVPEDINGQWGVSNNLDRLLISESGEFYGISHAVYHDYENSVHEPEIHTDGATWLVHWEETGAVADIRSLDIPFSETAFGSSLQSAAITDRYLWLCGGSQLLQLDQDGHHIKAFRIPEGYWETLHPLADGKLLLLGFAESEDGFGTDDRIACFFDIGKGEAGEAFAVPDVLKTGFTLQPVTNADNRTGSLLVWNETALWQWEPAAGTAAPLLRWLDSGIRSEELHAVFAQEDGSWLAIVQALADQETAGLPAGQPLLLCSMTAADDSFLANRTVITVGCDGTDTNGLTDTILNFNRSNPDIYIHLIDYSCYDTAENPSGGAAALENDIIRGQTPDILFLPNSTNNNTFIRKGLFIDLYPLLDADEQISREDLMENLLQACEHNGELVTLVPSYRILTLAAPADRAGSAPGWSWQEYEALLAQYPEDTAPIVNCSPQQALWYMLLMGGSRFLDYETGEAHLNTPEFIRVMERCGACHDSLDTIVDIKAELFDGRAVLKSCSLWGFTDMRQLGYEFENGVAFKGFPNDDGRYGSAVTPDLRIGITKDCKDPAAAWQFVREYLLPTFQNRVYQQTFDYVESFPLRKSALENAAKAAALPTRNIGWLPAYLDADDLPEKQQRYWMRGITQAECKQIIELIAGIDTVFQFDSSIYDILMEETAVYYAGQRSAADTADLLQSRIQTYLDEQS